MAPLLLKSVPYVLQGLSALGGIFGKKKKYMDAETLRQLYGPNAVGKDTTELAQYILNSPYGQQLMAQAAEQGQTFQNEMNAKAAAEGLSPDTGGQSAASDFATSSGAAAQAGLERQTRAGITQSAMPIAADMAAARMQAALMQQAQQNGDTNLMQRIGAAAGQTAATLPAAGPAPNPTPGISTSANVPTVGPAGTALVQQPVLQPAAGVALNEFQTGYKRPRFMTALTNSRSAGLTRR